MTSVMSSSKSKWGGDSSGSDNFSRLDEMDDLRPLGHDVEVGTGPRPTSMSAHEAGARRPSGMPVVPDRGIGVKTEVVVETSERLAYNDRLY